MKITTKEYFKCIFTKPYLYFITFILFIINIPSGERIGQMLRQEPGFVLGIFIGSFIQSIIFVIIIKFIIYKLITKKK